MKKLGLVGGMGPESTMVYYHDILHGVNHRSGHNTFPPILIDSVDLYEMLEYCKSDPERLTDLLVNSIEHLKSAGAEVVALTSNTSHMVFDQVKSEIDLPIVSILDTTCAEVIRLGYKKVGLLGTTFTMEGKFFKKPFTKAGINLFTPEPKLRRYVDEKITTELEMGIVKEDTYQEFCSMIRHMQDHQGIEALILGCTELPLLFQGRVSPIPLLDTMDLHVKALIDIILE